MEIEADRATDKADELIKASLEILAAEFPDATKTDLTERAFVCSLQSVMQQAQARGLSGQDCVAIFANAAGWLLAHITDPGAALRDFVQVTVAVMNAELADLPEELAPPTSRHEIN